MKLTETYKKPTHNFEADLAWSEYPGQYISYMQAISFWWPTADWNRIRDLSEQKEAKDISIAEPNGTLIHLQFKSRRKCYADCLIEYAHSYPSGYKKPGWIDIPSRAHYLLVCVPAGYVKGQHFFQRIYRVDYPPLHGAWTKYGSAWLKSKEFFHDHAVNKDYITWFICIPWETLKSVGVAVDFIEISPSGLLLNGATAYEENGKKLRESNERQPGLFGCNEGCGKTR